MEFKIESLNIGIIQDLKTKSGAVRSAYGKSPVASAILAESGFIGDQQADLKHHGGEDKAVCVFSAHHFSSYEDFLGIKQMPVPAFGENFTIDHLSENDVCVGDIFVCGPIKLQVSQPRQPCSKTGFFHGNNKVIKYMSDTGTTGFYFRVLQGGTVSRGDLFRKQDGDGGFSLTLANDIMYGRESDFALIKDFVEYPALSQAWKDELSSRIM